MRPVTAGGDGRRHAARRIPSGRHDPGEVYFVLQGEFAFYAEDPDGSMRHWTAAAGAVVPLAGGTPHTIRNESGACAAAFVVHAPGAPMEGFLRAGAALAAGGNPGMDAVLAIAAQHGIELLGPIPAAGRNYHRLLLSPESSRGRPASSSLNRAWHGVLGRIRHAG